MAENTHRSRMQPGHKKGPRGERGPNRLMGEVVPDVLIGLNAERTATAETSNQPDEDVGFHR